MTTPKHLKIVPERGEGSEAGFYSVIVGKLRVGTVGKSISPKDKKAQFTFIPIVNEGRWGTDEPPAAFTTRTMKSLRDELVRRILRDVYMRLLDRSHKLYGDD